MKKRILTILSLTVVIAIIAGLSIHSYLTPDTLFNNAPVSGNTAGNLYNSGYFCESDGKIFFANPSDSYRLYSMNSDGSELTKLSNDAACYINADSHYIYYIRNTSESSDDLFGYFGVNPDTLCRIDRDGKESSRVTLDSSPCLYASLIGDYIYYLHYDTENATTLYRVKIDGSEKEQVDSSPYFTCSSNGYDMYYNGLENNHNIWKMNTLTGSCETVFSGNCWMPTVTDNGAAVYYLDCEDNYKLACADISAQTTVTLSDDRIDCYNYYDGYLYFQRNDTEDAALCRMRADGSDYTVIAEGNYTDINVVSDCVYYCDFQSGIMYCTPLTKLSVREPFDPGTADN